MNIVHCLFAFETGGAQILSIDLMNGMCQHHKVSLIVVNNLINEKLLAQLDKRIAVYLLKRKQSSKNPLPVIRLNALLLKLAPDVIHCHEPRMALIIKVKKDKLIQTVHDIGIPTDNYELYRFSIAISDAVYDDVAGRHKEIQIEKIYNGINFELFNQREEYNLHDSEPIRLVQLSRLMHEKKGQHILLKALRKIADMDGKYVFHLDFIGTGDSKEYLENLIADLGLQDQATLAGERSREWLFKNLASYHILIQPSIYEGFGLTILEGFAAGLPVIASNIDGPAKIIANLPGGFLFENQDVDGCADALLKLSESYRQGQVKARMKQTIEVVRSKYSIKSGVEKYLNVYERL